MGEGADRACCSVDDQHHDSSHGERYRGSAATELL
jgi:hypothetical protein